MTGIGITNPLNGGSAGISARPSVFCHIGVTNTPVSIPRQPLVSSGFHSGRIGKKADCGVFSALQSVVTSTESGNAPKAVNNADSGFLWHRLRYLLVGEHA